MSVGENKDNQAHYYKNNLYLDAEFLEMWGGSLVCVEYKRTLDMQILSVFYDIQSTRSEIMTRTNYVRTIVDTDQIHNIGIQVVEIRDGSIVVNSDNFEAPKTLKV